MWDNVIALRTTTDPGLRCRLCEVRILTHTIEKENSKLLWPYNIVSKNKLVNGNCETLNTVRVTNFIRSCVTNFSHAVAKQVDAVCKVNNAEG